MFSLPVIIVMIIGGGIALYAKSQMRTGAPWAQPLALVGAVIAIGAAIWSLIGTISGSSTAAAMEREQRYIQIEHKFLGEGIMSVANNVKKVAVVVDPNIYFDEWGEERPTPSPYPALEGLKEGLGADVEIVLVKPAVQKLKKPSDPAAMPPMMGNMMDRKKFQQCIKEAKDSKADVTVFMWMMPPEMRLAQACTMLKGMQVAIANSGSLDQLSMIFADAGKRTCDLLAVVTSKASAIYDDTIPGSEEKAFNRRYALITKNNYQQAIQDAQAK